MYKKNKHLDYSKLVNCEHFNQALGVGAFGPTGVNPSMPATD